MKHKHCDLIKAWADGAIIEHYRPSFGWEECSSNTPCWSPETNYRIKPKTIKYRTYLWQDSFGRDGVYSCTYQQNIDNDYEYHKNFIKWLGDWQEVEVS